MIRQSLLAILLYFAGGIALVLWSVTGFVSGAPKDDWALMILLPIAWIFSYWPMYGMLVAIQRVRGLQRTLERLAEGVKGEAGPADADIGALVESLTTLVATENRLPEFIVRPFVRKTLVHVLAEVGKTTREAVSGA